MSWDGALSSKAQVEDSLFLEEVRRQIVYFAMQQLRAA